MKYIKKDVDRTLLVLLIFFLVLFLSFTVYYETTLRKTLSIKGESDKILSEVTAQSIMEKLNATDRIRKYASIDREMLEEKYSDLLVQQENLEKEKTKLQEELILLKSQLEYQQVKIDGPVAQFKLIQEKNQQINELKEKIDALCLMLNSTNFSGKECE